MAILTSLGIEWQQLLAQIINFAVIATVLAVFVYKPVLKLLDERRERIRKAMEQADAMEKQSKEFEKIRLEKLKAIDAEAAEWHAQAKKDVEETRQRLLASANSEAEGIKAKAMRDMDEERRTLEREFKERAVSIITTLTAKILQREFTPADQERIAGSLEKDIASNLK